MRAKGDKVAGDSQKHFLDNGGEGPGFVFGPGGGIGKLAQRVQSAFEGDAAQIDIVGEGGLLHEAANEVVGDEMHAQFALYHVGRLAAQDVHVEEDFNLPEVKFDAPTPKIKIGEIGGGNGGIEQGGYQGNALGAKAWVGNGVADDPHLETLGQKFKLLRGHGRRALGGALPGYEDIKIWSFGKLGADGYADLFFRQTHEGIDLASGQTGDGSVGAKPPVSESEIARV